MSNFVNPAVQAMNLVRRIGNEVSESCEPLREFPGGDRFSAQLVEELVELGIVKVANTINTHQSTTFMGVNLTLKGWEQYESEKRGDFRGNYGFMAMQFGDPALDPFVKDIVKPAVQEELGYDLVDMRDVARAGVIDNIMRTRIRDAAFVIVDLTHDNSGAYWEAGYAEGLGKPVIYICEKGKFDAKKTHFDTNHCMTVPWSRDDDDGFRQALIATLRRSLDL